MTTRKKALIFTAFLLILLTLALITPLFGNIVNACRPKRHHKPHHPPLGKCLIKHFVYPDGSGIGPCLEVELYNDQLLYTAHTDPTGTVVFAGIPDGTYTVVFSWQGEEYREHLEIRCPQITWEFTNTLPYWTVEKTFTYPDGTPIEGLYVTMDGWSGYTDSTGTVVFSNVKAGDYTISWSWQGVSASESVSITFSTPSPVVLENELPFWTVEKTFTYPDGTPIVGLDVSCDGQTDITDASGMVTFTGLKECVDYTISWSWQNQSDSETVHVTDFQTPSPVLMSNELPYWTVEKTFYYDTIPPIPISHLSVTLDGVTKETDVNGFVCFDGLKAGTYTLEWMWNSTTQTEDIIIGFQDPSPFVVPDNYLEPKSGGGKSTLG